MVDLSIVSCRRLPKGLQPHCQTSQEEMAQQAADAVMRAYRVAWRCQLKVEVLDVKLFRTVASHGSIMFNTYTVIYALLFNTYNHL